MTDATGLTTAWAAIEALARQPRPDGSPPASIRPLFAADPDRFGHFSWEAEGLLLDLSKTALTPEGLTALLALAEAAGLPAQRDAMARGEVVNTTERRAVLHMALRAPRDAGFRAGTEDASAEVAAVLDRMREFCAAVHGGMARGAPPLGAPAGAAGQPSPTWSISASAAPTSAPPWWLARSGPRPRRCAPTTWRMSMRMPGRRCGRSSTRRGPWCWWPRRPSPPRRP